MELFKDWLTELDKELNLGGELVLDEHQRCFLLFDENLLVSIIYHPHENAYELKGTLGTINRLHKKQIHARLIEANLIGELNGIAHFAIEKYSEKALLIQSLTLDTCDYPRFNKSLELFVNLFEYWTKNLTSLTTKATQAQIVGLRV